MTMNQDVTEWNVEDSHFWKTKGKAIANRNLIISILCLLLGFAVWMYWSVITVQMMNLGFKFSQDDMFSIIAVGSFGGATIRIPNAFLIRIAGGRNTIFLTTFFLIIPTLGTGIALMNPNTPLWQFQVLALLGGIGGGNFCSSMSNISFLYPKRLQGYAQGMNGGLGNFGVTTMQVLIPLVLLVGLIGGSHELVNKSGTLIGVLSKGTHLFIQNGAFVWTALIVPMSALAWVGMNNILTDNVSPNLDSTASSFGKITLMIVVAMVIGGVGIFTILPSATNGFFASGTPWYLIFPIVVVITLVVLRVLPFGIGESLSRQYQIFKNPHTWILSILYLMSFGSFIGFVGAFGLSIKLIFGFKHILGADGHLIKILNPNAPPALSYAWLGAFVGALIRPIGGIIADKIGGSLITALTTFLMVIYALGVGYYMYKAYHSATPEVYFMPFLIIFLLLFSATGVANGSIFRTGAVIFDNEQAGPLLGWIGAIGAYGGFMIPKFIAPAIKAGTPENVMIGLAIFYAICLLITIVFYLRPGVKYSNA